MVTIHKETVAFNKAVEWIKVNKRVRYKEIAEQLGIKRADFDMIRVQRRRVKPEEVEILQNIYQENLQFFEPEKTDFDEEGDIVSILKKSFSVQNKLISEKEEKEMRLKAENEALKKEIAKYKAEIDELLRKQSLDTNEK